VSAQALLSSVSCSVRFAIVSCLLIAVREIYRDMLALILASGKSYYWGADKSLARPGWKQALKHVRDARDFNDIETRAVIKFFFP